MKLKLSIAIPTYNQAQYLKKAILSACNQNYKPFEIVVFDDCSTDNTWQILEELCIDIKELKIIRQEINKGIVINKGSCLKSCTGDYVILLDSDDMLEPNFADVLIALLEKFPKAAYAHGNVQQIDQNGNKTNVRQLFRKETYLEANEDLKRQISGMKVAANIIMYRKKALVAINYFNCKVNFAEDWFMLCQLSAAGYGNVFTNKILSSYRVWSDTGQLRQKRKLDEINGTRLVYDEVLIPAYRERNWSINAIIKAKSKKAISNSDCLSFSYFTKEEKSDLKEVLLMLSDSRATKVNLFLQTYKTHLILKFVNKLKINIRRNLKVILVNNFGKRIF